LNIKTQESVFYSTPDDKVEAKQEELKAKQEKLEAKQEKFEAHKENRAKALVSFTKKTKGGKVRKKYR
jgi:Skp family chaperone for outer membrane proteins